MKRFKRKIICGAVLAGCTLLFLGGFTIAEKHSRNAAPVSLDTQEDRPMIILDAGHGGSC